MKTLKNLSLIFFLSIFAVSCVQDDDFDVPEISTEEPDITANITVGDIVERYDGFEPVLLTAGEESDVPLWVEAYVVSSDESGNYYKQLIVQSSPENPEAGISISTEVTDLYTKYEPGRKIYFRVDGLFTGEYAGLPTLGTFDGSDEVGRIGIDDFNSRIMRSLEVTELVPTEISIQQANSNANYLNTLIKLTNVEFADEEVGETYANPDNTFSVNRTVVNCAEDEVILRNSGFSDFHGVLLPEGNGSLVAIQSIFNDTFQLFIRDTDDVMFMDPRCEDEPTNTSLPFLEDFESYPSGAGEVLNIDQWTNTNANGGPRLWEVRDFDGNKYAQTTAFNSGEDPYEAWLVTPGFDLAGVPAGTFSFESKDGYNNGIAIQVFVSTDFNGDVTTATWTELNATFSTGNTSGYGDEFVSSGDIDLSAYEGQVVYFGFKYLGGDSGITTTYQIDNVSVTE